MSDAELRARYLGVDGHHPHSLAELSRLLGVQRRTVRARLKRLKVRIRLPREAARLAPARRGWRHSPESKTRMGEAVRRWRAGMSPEERAAESERRRRVWQKRPPEVRTRMLARAAAAPKGRWRAVLREAVASVGLEVSDGRGGADFWVNGWAVLADGFWRLQMPVERVRGRIRDCLTAGARGVIRVCHAGRKTPPPSARLLDEIHKIVYNPASPDTSYHELDYG